MKRILLSIVIVVFLFTGFAIAEYDSEQAYKEDLVKLMNAEYPFEDDMEWFAEKYAGQVISIDGFIYDAGWGSFMRDIEIQIGDRADATRIGPSFLFKRVDPEDFGFKEQNFPDFIEYGKDVRAVGQVDGYDDFDESIILKPISIEVRNPLLEELDVSVYVTLEKGSKGDDVKVLQQRLIDLYYLDGNADGVFGNGTKTAVEKFQKAVELDANGIADPITQAILFSDKAPEASLSISCSSVVVGSNAKTVWYVDGQEFTLQGSNTKTIKTRWGTYKFDAFGNSEKIED